VFLVIADEINFVVDSLKNMSKIKIFKASPFYIHYLNQFYIDHLGLNYKSYHEQYQTIMADFFGWYDLWKTSLEATGNYEVVEVISNAKQLQETWAKESGLKLNGDNWQQDILERQILEFQPDIFFAHDFGVIDAKFRVMIKKKCPSIKLIIGWDGVAVNNKDIFKGCDVMLSCVRDTVDYYNSNGFKSDFFSFGFNEKLLEKIKNENHCYDLLFCGSIGSDKHSNRLDFLYEINKKCKLDLLANPLDVTLKNYLGSMARLDLKRFQYLNKIKALSRVNHGQVFGIKMFQALANSRIVLNSHIDVAGDRASNMRLFEATGVGACLVTDYKPELKELFDLDREVVAYKSTKEAIDKIGYLLNNEDERRKIAIAGQKKIIDNYPSDRQIKQVINDITKSL
jgi:glycosyltransferase involved in cell wall biosynthesis